ncbi:NUDIX hydrolase [Paenibacillus paeoniae]|uniref:NUDIX domain-containing protein n=1 Tax=Paenibacillus paeoniae TaxID=2292705 RepID=A0A371PIA5_9BACL|nr:NUDIX domain-containing protein [Paenibacillus paeoniae]REK75635.1 NUDIX domain-containing protein [Paenibacillus paeoniae]
MEMIKRITDNDILGSAPEWIESISRYGARGVLVDDMLNVAMMHMSKTNLYKLPGGGINEGESTKDAFLREVKEETGCEAEIIHELGYIEEHKNKNDFMQFSYCFIAKVRQGISKTMLSDSELQLGMTVEWMTLDKALEVMEHSMSNCNDYSTKFMILRDKIILEKAVGLLPVKRTNRRGNRR